MESLIILGAGGHGKVAADVASLQYHKIFFLDDRDIGGCMRFPVVGRTADAEKFLDTGDFFVAIGNPKIRQAFTESLESIGANVVSLIHPNSVISRSAVIGSGSIIMPGAVINTEVTVGKSCIINTCSSVDHESILEDYVHIAVGAHVSGEAHIGMRTWIGTGAVVSNNVSVCDDCMIGAGAAVVRDIIKKGTYIGVPARLKQADIK